MKHVTTHVCGVGFGAMDNFWENYHGQQVCRPFLLWQDLGGLYVYTGSVGYTVLAPAPANDWHLYEWLYMNGQYQFSMDGIVRATGDCAPRATRVFFGHPHPVSCYPWTSMAIDFIEIVAQGAAADARTTWGGMKASYR
jgi:hypothetical protein